jgi:hypothetical protein
MVQDVNSPPHNEEDFGPPIGLILERPFFLLTPFRKELPFLGGGSSVELYFTGGETLKTVPNQEIERYPDGLLPCRR